MKKNDLYRVLKFTTGYCLRNILGFMFVLLVCQQTQAQAQEQNEFVNLGELGVVGDILSTKYNFSNNGSGLVQVKQGAKLFVLQNYENQSLAKFVNDGEVYIFSNWTNYGLVTYTKPSSASKSKKGKAAAANTGKTFFGGVGGFYNGLVDKKQVIKSNTGITSEFQDITFDNDSEANAAAFGLETAVITVDGNVDFSTGIVGADKNSKVVFNADASHDNASDFSFVDGKVEKNGTAEFQFPVGNDVYFRPSYHAAGDNIGNSYTTQYFYQNSNNLHAHTRKDDDILVINDTEYWEVTATQRSENIVLSLTLDSQTTPNGFLNPSDTDTEVAVVRWDDTLLKWVNEGGVVSEADTDVSKGGKFSKLLMTKTRVSGFGIFTMAIVKKKDVAPTDVIVYNAISPNGDGLNDSFLIEGINKYPDNEVEIYNRWGVKVYDAKSYNENDIMFRGYSDGRVTVKRGEKLPTGTYFYILKYNNGQKGIEKSGYLYINNQ